MDNNSAEVLKVLITALGGIGLAWLAYHYGRKSGGGSKVD